MVVMVVVVATMMVVPTVMAVMTMMSPVHFGRRQPGVFLNRRGGAGIAERHRVDALGWSCEREQRANGGESQNFRKLHACSPWVRCHVCAELHRRNAVRNLTPPT
jgi:hypothetical protein